MEFFTIILEKSSSRQVLPDNFVKMVDAHRPQNMKLRQAGNGLRKLWDVELVFDTDRSMYLDRDWKQFVRSYDLRHGYFLVFRYDGNATFGVKVFDMTMCRRRYQDDDDAKMKFFTIILEKSSSRQVLSDNFVKMLDGHRPQNMKLRSSEYCDRCYVYGSSDSGYSKSSIDSGYGKSISDDGLAMVIPQLGDRAMPILVEEYIPQPGLRLRCSKRIRMMKEKVPPLLRLRGHNANESLVYDRWYEPYFRRIDLLQFVLKFKGTPPWLNSTALTALTDRWRPETHSLHLALGEMTIILDDIAMNTGCTIEGRALTARTTAAGTTTTAAAATEYAGGGCCATPQATSAPVDANLSEKGEESNAVHGCGDGISHHLPVDGNSLAARHSTCETNMGVRPPVATPSPAGAWLPVDQDSHNLVVADCGGEIGPAIRRVGDANHSNSRIRSTCCDAKAHLDGTSAHRKWEAVFEDVSFESRRQCFGSIVLHFPSRWVTIRDEDDDILAGTYLQVNQVPKVGDILEIDGVQVLVGNVWEEQRVDNGHPEICDLTASPVRYGGRFWALADQGDEDEVVEEEDSVIPVRPDHHVDRREVEALADCCLPGYRRHVLDMRPSRKAPKPKEGIRPWIGPVPKVPSHQFNLADFFAPDWNLVKTRNRRKSRSLAVRDKQAPSSVHCSSGRAASCLKMARGPADLLIDLGLLMFGYEARTADSPDVPLVILPVEETLIATVGAVEPSPRYKRSSLPGFPRLRSGRATRIPPLPESSDCMAGRGQPSNPLQQPAKSSGTNS
ncbi:Alpha-L-arabinofuranosidase 1 [Hordeum vulgare]|nr:Alpha-L-arabinofuranosidase 1 [Hordeum vulgare]